VTRTPAHKFFFPAAALHAALLLPASIAAMLGWIARLPGLAMPVGHAHEMVFGFGLAVVAGNQLGPTRRATLAALAVTWIVARVAFVLAPESLIAAAANAAFAGFFAWLLVPRLTAPIRKLRNRALPAAVVALCVAALAMQAALQAGSGTLQHLALQAGVLVLAALMLFMGGRIIAPAAAGHAYRAGGDLAARVQPRIEGALIVAMLFAIVALPAGATRLAAVALAAAALLAAVRLARWRPWRLHGRPDIVALVAGYAWLVAGLAAVAYSLHAGGRIVSALHVITIGAMGTLTINVMALTYARLARRDPAGQSLPIRATALVAAAVVARLAADVAPGDARVAWLAGAAACWSIAYLMLLAAFARLSR
jgi:uncharacterized protein involved in response to NO